MKLLVGISAALIAAFSISAIAASTIKLVNQSGWDIHEVGVVTLSFSGRKGQGLVDIQAKQAAIFHASKASRRW